MNRLATGTPYPHIILERIFATGTGLGFVTYALAKLVAGKFAGAKPAVLVLR